MRFLALSLLVAAAAATAQPSNWTFTTPGSYVALSAERPSFSGNLVQVDFGAATSALTFEVAQEFGPVRVVGELPFAYASISDPTGVFQNDEAGAVLGNVQLGVEARVPFSPLRFGGYLRVPTTSGADDVGDRFAAFVGGASDYERVGAYAEDVLTVAAMAEARPSLPTAPVAFRLRLSPQLAVATDDNALSDDAEVFVSYAAQAIVSAGVARIGGGLSGISLLTEDTDERHSLSVGAMADVGLGSLFRAGVTGRLPITGDVEEVIDGVIGIRVLYGGL